MRPNAARAAAALMSHRFTRAVGGSGSVARDRSRSRAADWFYSPAVARVPFEAYGYVPTRPDPR